MLLQGKKMFLGGNSQARVTGAIGSRVVYPHYKPDEEPQPQQFGYLEMRSPNMARFVFVDGKPSLEANPHEVLIDYTILNLTGDSTLLQITNYIPGSDIGYSDAEGMSYMKDELNDSNIDTITHFDFWTDIPSDSQEEVKTHFNGNQYLKLTLHIISYEQTLDSTVWLTLDNDTISYSFDEPSIEPEPDYVFGYHNDNYFEYCAARYEKRESSSGTFTEMPTMTARMQLYEYVPTVAAANGMNVAGTAGNLIAYLPEEAQDSFDDMQLTFFGEDKYSEVGGWSEAAAADLRFGLLDTSFQNGYRIVNASGESLTETELENLPSEAWIVWTFTCGGLTTTYSNLVSVVHNHVDGDGDYVELAFKGRAFVNWNVADGKEITLSTSNNRPTVTASSTGMVQYWNGDEMTATYNVPEGEYGRFHVNYDDYAKGVNPTWTLDENRWQNGGELITLYAGQENDIAINIQKNDTYNEISLNINDTVNPTVVNLKTDDEVSISWSFDSLSTTESYVKLTRQSTGEVLNMNDRDNRKMRNPMTPFRVDDSWNGETLTAEIKSDRFWSNQGENIVYYFRDGVVSLIDGDFTENDEAYVFIKYWLKAEDAEYDIDEIQLTGTFQAQEANSGRDRILSIPAETIKNALTSSSSFQSKLSNGEFIPTSYTVYVSPIFKKTTDEWTWEYCDNGYEEFHNDYGYFNLSTAKGNLLISVNEEVWSAEWKSAEE